MKNKLLKGTVNGILFSLPLWALLITIALTSIKDGGQVQFKFRQNISKAKDIIAKIDENLRHSLEKI